MEQVNKITTSLNVKISKFNIHIYPETISIPIIHIDYNEPKPAIYVKNKLK